MEPSRCGGSDFREQAIVSEGFDWVYKWERKYLVELHGELMLLIRLKDRDCKIISFNLYKLKPGYKRWMRVTSLGDYALFVGINSSFSISDNDDPSGRCKPNCIYFSDHDQPANFDSNIGGHDLGVFNLKGDGSVEQWPYYTDKPESLWYCRLPYGSRPPFIKLHPASNSV